MLQLGFCTRYFAIIIVLAAFSCSLNSCGAGTHAAASFIDLETAGTLAGLAPGSSPPIDIPRITVDTKGKKPISKPDAVPRLGGVPLKVHFFDGGSSDPDGFIVMWEWNFSSAGGWEDFTSTQGEAWHTFNKPGNRIAHLRVTDNDGNKDVASVSIEMRTGNNSNPIAVASSDLDFGHAPLTVVFSASGSYDPDGTLVTWEWDFDDGSGFQDFTNEEGEISHEYLIGGLYAATLRITDDDGAASTASVTVDINEVPVAVANASPDSGNAPLEVTFHAGGSHDVDGTITAIYWDFDDGAGFQDFTGDGGAAVYIYQSHGQYTAILMVIDDDGASSQATVDITVLEHRGDWWMFGRGLTHRRQSPIPGPKAGNLKWGFNAGVRVYSSPAIGADGTIYIGSGHWSTGNFYAINPDGSMKWSYPARGVECSPAIGVDGTIYFGTGTGNFYALNPDGTYKWHYPTGSIIGSSPVIAPDGTIYFGNRSGTLYALDTEGNLKWEYNTGYWIYGSPALGSDGTIYIGSAGLQAINPDGTLAWRFGNWYVHWSSPSIAGDGTIYIGSTNGYFYAINPDNSLKWQYYGAGSRSSPAIADDGSIYVRGRDNYLYALTAGGDFKWKKLTGNRSGDWTSSSPTIGGDGNVYVGGWDNRIHAFTKNGDPLWALNTGDIVGGSAAIGADGTLYIGNNLGYVIAVHDGPPAIPPPPTGVSAANGTGYQSCKVNWNNVLGADDFRVYRALDFAGSYTLVAPSTNGQTFFGDTTGDEFVHYWYKIASVNTSGEGALSLADEGWRVAPRPQPDYPPGDWGVDVGGGIMHWFVDIPEGPVQLGSPNSEWTHTANEEVYQEFTVPAFAIAKYPTTNRQWLLFMEDGGYEDSSLWNYGWSWKTTYNITMPAYWLNSNYAGPGKEEYPVVGLSWYEANAYANWVKFLAEEQALSKVIRMPFEDEWERAAEGDTQKLFPWGDAGIQNLGDDEDWAKCNSRHNIYPDTFNQTSPVYWFPEGVSPFGVFDMVGNKWEWNGSRYTSKLGYPYQRIEYVDVGTPGLRGWGNWQDRAIRTSFRTWSNGPGGRYADSASRLAADPDSI